MAFPTKMYFSLSEVSARWHRQTKDVEYCIENGLLNAHIKVCSVKLTSNMLLNKFPHNSQEIYEYTGCKRITPEDCHILFRHYKRQVSEFISSDDTKREKLVFPEKITIKKVDLMILLCDLKQFEEKYKLKYEEQELPLWNNNASSSEIAVNNDCDFFYIGNTLYSFGHIQAKIIRELHKAAQSPNPWLLGKNLLIDSGARTQHLKDLFKSHPILPRIKYRSKGYYSLSLEKLSTNS